MGAETNHPGFMMDVKRFSKTSLDVNGKLNILIQRTQDDNDTWVGYIEDPRRASEDDIGALYYVVAVILIYGLSIVMMIASHIRKNKQDNQLRTYLKEMAKLRKDDRREKVLSKISDIAKRRQQQGESQRLQDKQKDVAADNEADNEVCQPLMKNNTKDQINPESIYLLPDYYILQDCNSPTLSDSRSNTVSGRVRSLSFHDYRRGRGNESRPSIVQDCKSVRIQSRASPILSDQRSTFTPLGSQYPSLNDFHLLPREQSPALNEDQSFRWTKPKSLSPNDTKFQRISEKQASPESGHLQPIWPVIYQVVDEDAVL